MNNKELFENYFSNIKDGIWAYRNEIFEYEKREDQLKIVKKYSHLLEGEIKCKDFDWKDADKDEKTQLRIYKALNEGIVTFSNIPSIPKEFDQYSKRYFGFDTEDNGYGFPHFYQFSWDDGIAFSLSFRLLIRWASQSFNMAKFNHIVWGTNIEYELGSIVKDFDVSNDTMELRWRRGSTTKVCYRYSPKMSQWGNPDDLGGWFIMWDTMNHWKMSVEKQGKALSKILNEDFSKLDKDFYSFKYAAMDAIISRSYACIQRAEYEKRGIPLKLTPGQSSLEWYQKGKTDKGEKFCDHRLYKTHEEWELDWMMPALRGGRTEVFSLKEYKGKIGYFDINSAYPFSMKFGVFPDLTEHWWIEGHDKILEAINRNYEGILECEVDASKVDMLCQVVPYLGMKEETTGRFIFPLGKWKDKYTIFEIRRAMKHGYKFKFIKAIVYRRLPESPFVKYIDAAYGLRLEGARTGNDILKDIGKSLGNNLFGKFGQRSVFTKLDDPSFYTEEQLLNMKTVGDAVIVEEDNGYAPQTNVVWGAYITAMTRDLLFNHFIAAIKNDNEVIYCDSVTKNRKVLIEDENGMLKVLSFEELWNLSHDKTIIGEKENALLPYKTLSWDASVKKLEFKPIKKIIRHKTNKRILKVFSNKGITEVTEDHSLINENNERIKAEDIETLFSPKSYLENISYKEINSIDMNDYMSKEDFLDFSSYEKEKSKYICSEEWLSFQFTNSDLSKTAMIKRHWNNEDLLKFMKYMAFFIGDGSISTPHTTKTRFMFSINSEKLNELKKFKEFLESVTKNIKFNIIESSNFDNTYKLSSGTKLMAYFMKSLIGQKAKGKKLPDFIFNLSKKHKEEFIKGLLIGDGSKIKDSRYTQEYRNRNFSYCTQSEKLANQLSVLFSMLGYSHAINYREEKSLYTLTTNSKNKDLKPKIEEIKYDDYVYDLSIEDNENFFDCMGIIGLHNTDSIFISGGQWPESHQTELGALKHEGDLTFFKAVLPKTYIYETNGKRTYKAKGVPFDQRERFLVSGRVEYRKPLKLRESLVRKKFNEIDEKKGLKAGIQATNAWITVTKELKGKYTKRVVHKDLSTTPIILD